MPHAPVGLIAVMTVLRLAARTYPRRITIRHISRRVVKLPRRAIKGIGVWLRQAAALLAGTPPPWNR